MANIIKLKRGLSSNIQSSSLQQAELAITTDTNKLYTADSKGNKIVLNNDTTYSLSKSGSTITLTGSDGSTTSVTDSNTTYSLPTARSNTLGGVKTTSTVTSTSGLTACPIISGVPYYKDTNTTYTLSTFGITATAAELNYVDGVTSNIQTQLNGKAASSHGTHVTYSTTAPAAAGTASAGSAATVSRSDHVHPAQTTITGNAGSATKLATARTINGVSFDGSKNITLTADPKTNTLTSDDLNSILTPGFYNGGGSNTCTNKPSGVDAFGLIVFKTASGYTTQDLIEGNHDAQKRWSRQHSGSAWSNWIQIYTSAHPQTAITGNAATATTASKTSKSLTINKGGTATAFNGSEAKTVSIPTVHYGTTEPSASLGQDGDIYIVLES